MLQGKDTGFFDLLLLSTQNETSQQSCLGKEGNTEGQTQGMKFFALEVTPYILAHNKLVRVNYILLSRSLSGGRGKSEMGEHI